MGLENLKSVFTEGVGNNESQIKGRFIDIEIPNLEVVNYFGPTNSYFPTLQTPIEGFTANFNQGGYTFGDGEPGNSLFLNTISDFQTRTIQANLPSIGQKGLGFGDFQSPVNFPNTNDRIRQGLNFVSDTIRSPLGQLVGGATLGQGTLDRFTDVVGEAQVGYQVFNSVTNMTVGIDTITNMVGPINISGDGQVTINSTKHPRYEDTVFERRNPDGRGAMDTQDPKNDTATGVRGIVFQANVDKAPTGRAPSSPPRSLLMESFGGRDHFQDAVVGPPDFTFNLKDAFNSLKSAYVIPGSIGVQPGSVLDKTIDNLKEKFRGSMNDEINPDKLKSGFGAPNKEPEWMKNINKLKDDLLSNVTSIFGSIGGGLMEFGSGLTEGVSAFGNDLMSAGSQIVGGLGSATLDIGKDIASTISNNIDVELPSIKLQNPFPPVSRGEYGGVAMLIGRNPRADELATNNTFPKKRSRPQLTNTTDGGGAQTSGEDSSTLSILNDSVIEKNATSTPYSNLGKDDKHYFGTGLPGKITPKTFGYPNWSMDEKGKGDYMTNLKPSTGDTLDQAYPDDYTTMESTLHGMPFYFKDLRVNKYIVFRAYIESLTENLSGDWNSEDYIGRSEPVYTYKKGTRDLSFSLKLFAQTADELGNIYGKLNQLSSLCYPFYKPDMNMGGKLKMKPPLTKFRYGELFGNEKKELLGFIKSINYAYPDTSPWEFRKGQRVPKHITAQIGYTVIHDEVPQLGTPFYGWLGD